MAIRQTEQPELLNFKRDSMAFTGFDSDGVPLFVGPNEPRAYVDDEGNRLGILLESGKTNYLANSLDPVTQTVVLGAGVYTFSALTDSSVTIETPTQTLTFDDDPVTFTIDTDKTSVTVSPQEGTRAFQIEDGSFVTSIIGTDDNGAQARESESISHGREAYFSRNTGTFIGRFSVPVIEEEAVYFYVETDGTDFVVKGTQTGLLFKTDQGEIPFQMPEGEDIKFAISYDATKGYVRCYLNDEVGELDIPFIKPEKVTFSSFPHPTMMILKEYEYRPRPLGNAEIGRSLGNDYDLQYDFVVEPLKVSDWATRIFAASLYGFNKEN